MPDLYSHSHLKWFFQEEYIRPSVITPNLQFSRSASRERFRWNHRSHPSIDSDSSFESEHENDFSQPGPWIFSKSGDAIDISITASRCSSIGSVRRRESMSSNDQPDLVHTDTENDNDVIESSTSVSSGYYKVRYIYFISVWLCYWFLKT